MGCYCKRSNTRWMQLWQHMTLKMKKEWTHTHKCTDTDKQTHTMYVHTYTCTHMHKHTSLVLSLLPPLSLSLSLSLFAPLVVMYMEETIFRVSWYSLSPSQCELSYCSSASSLLCSLANIVCMQVSPRNSFTRPSPEKSGKLASHKQRRNGERAESVAKEW